MRRLVNGVNVPAVMASLARSLTEQETDWQCRPCQTTACVRKEKQVSSKDSTSQNLLDFQKRMFSQQPIAAIADRLANVAPVDWDLSAQALTAVLDGAEQQKLVQELEARAQKFARLASYLYLRIGPSNAGDRGHAEAVKRQNKTGRTLHKAFGYDGRSSADIRF